MKEFHIGMKLDNYYAVYISEDGYYQEKVMVKEDNLEGFIQCLEHFGFHLWTMKNKILSGGFIVWILKLVIMYMQVIGVMGK